MGNSSIRPNANMKPHREILAIQILAKSPCEGHHAQAPENGWFDILGGSTPGIRLYPGRLKSDGHVSECWRPNIMIKSSRIFIQQVIDMNDAHLQTGHSCRSWDGLIGNASNHFTGHR